MRVGIRRVGGSTVFLLLPDGFGSWRAPLAQWYEDIGKKSGECRRPDLQSLVTMKGCASTSRVGRTGPRGTSAVPGSRYEGRQTQHEPMTMIEKEM